MMFWSSKTEIRILADQKIWITGTGLNDSPAFVRSSIRQSSLTCVLLRPPVSPENTAVSTDNSTLSNKKKQPARLVVGKAGGGWRSIFEINMQGANSGTAQLEYKGWYITSRISEYWNIAPHQTYLLLWPVGREKEICRIFYFKLNDWSNGEGQSHQ